MVFFFFKQKTAYEVRISDWSSDVCSSDLVELFLEAVEGIVADVVSIPQIEDGAPGRVQGAPVDLVVHRRRDVRSLRARVAVSSEERRVGTACARPCRYRWSPYP